MVTAQSSHINSFFGGGGEKRGSQSLLTILDTWGIAQNRNIAGSRKAAMYIKQSSTCIKALVTMSFKHCTAFSEFSSYFKSWITKILKL